ncbi:MAG: histidine kinase [Firmicutes bacterium]|nr:histidine kinase [Bacillota bacterium]
MMKNKPVTHITAGPTGASQSIRGKILFPFLAMIGIFALVSFLSYYNEQSLLRRINLLLANNIKLKDFSCNVDNAVTYLEKYLVSRNFEMLRKYYLYSQEIDAEYPDLTVVDQTPENYLLLANIRNMTRAFLQQMEKAEKAKRARDSSGYHQAFVQVVRYSANIKWAVDRLITRQLEENSRQYLLISERLITIQRMGLILITGAIAFSIAVTIWASWRLMNPLRKLVAAAKAVSQGNFSLAPLPVSSNDETAVVTAAFNEMIASIRKLIEEIKQKSDLEIRLQDQEYQNLAMKSILREAELHALQSQINPHFLFNMLNAGVQLAIMEGADQTADYVDKVSSLLRYNLRKLDLPVTLQEEAAHLETYFFILKTRFGPERFEFVIDIDPAVAHYQIPLLTLQPIVENALIHGVENLEQGGRIEVKAQYITACQGANQVLIQVSDNGLGMDEATLSRLQNGAKAAGHTTGLGLQNVRDRLRLFYGQDDLLTIKSVPNQGTIVQIILPVEKRGLIDENPHRG